MEKEKALFPPFPKTTVTNHDCRTSSCKAKSACCFPPNEHKQHGEQEVGRVGHGPWPTRNSWLGGPQCIWSTQ